LIKRPTTDKIIAVMRQRQYELHRLYIESRTKMDRFVTVPPSAFQSTMKNSYICKDEGEGSPYS